MHGLNCWDWFKVTQTKTLSDSAAAWSIRDRQIRPDEKRLQTGGETKGQYYEEPNNEWSIDGKETNRLNVVKDVEVEGVNVFCFTKSKRTKSQKKAE